MELVRLSPNRPVTVIDPDGWRVYVSVHDAYYVRTLAGFRARLRLRHTDHGRCDDQQIRWLIGAYRSWKRREAAWYASVGLVPPHSSGIPCAAHPVRHRRPYRVRTARLCKPVPVTAQAVHGALLERGDQSIATIAQGLGMTTDALRVAVHRLRARGVLIRTTFVGGARTYQLVRDAA